MGVNTARRLPAAEHVLQHQAPRPGQPAPTEPSVPPLQLQPRAAAERLLSLDVFRGITIVAMLIVNNPGTARFGYRALQHAEWNGCQPPDLIFPFFLFIVGVAIIYSLAQQQSRGVTRSAIIIKIARRSATIFGIGMLLNALPYFDWEITRIPGVLQRIALCYCTASLVVVYTGIGGQALTAVSLAGRLLGAHDVGACSRLWRRRPATGHQPRGVHRPRADGRSSVASPLGSGRTVEQPFPRYRRR